MVIHTRPGSKKPAHHIELAMNTKTNRAEVTVDNDKNVDFPPIRLKTLGPAMRDPGFLNPENYDSPEQASASNLKAVIKRAAGAWMSFLN